MNGMMGIVMIGGVGVAALGGFQLSKVGPAPFSYDNASAEARRAFLTEEATDMARVVRRSLVSPSGVGPSFDLTGTTVDEYRRRIQFEITVRGSGTPDPTAFHALSKKMKQAECPRYVGTRLSESDVEISYSFVDKNNRRIQKVSISNGYCRGYLTA